MDVIFLPFVVFNVQIEAQQLRATFIATGALLLLGFVISCWQDFRSKAPFSVGRLIYVVTMVIVYTIVTPVFMSAVVAAR